MIEATAVLWTPGSYGVWGWSDPHVRTRAQFGIYEVRDFLTGPANIPIRTFAKPGQIAGSQRKRPIVAIDCRYLGAQPSGIGELVQALVDHAPALAPDLDFLFLKRPSVRPRLSSAENVREVEVRHAANSPATMWFLSRVVDLSGLDLFHATYNIMPGGLRMPCVTTIHDVMWLTDPSYCRARFWKPAEAWFYRQGILRALENAAAIATVSQASSSAIAAFAPETKPRLRVTLSGVAPDFRPRDAPAAILDRLGLAPDCRFVLTVGQNAPYKNHEGALRAFASAFPSRSDVHLILLQRLGKGGEHLLARARELGIAPRVKFLSGISRKDLIGLYSNAAALLHPSFCEGFGNPLAEAMACGCPVVTSNVSAMPEVCGDAALLADPHDPVAMGANLRRVVDDPSLAAVMSARGRERCTELSWRRFAEANVEIYRELLRMADTGVFSPGKRGSSANATQQGSLEVV